ncbi:hypothetical protein P154DRAFT_519596 [Amniculicola lignicola CBS 123094]|uniref:Uncharacterized protein n=1 Tax=Amniculicola lignicola CBS 123094 TaxID=1392246 RepID=A0A6A5WR49_9PLEO|nr:hypothetical protein P154DRAFT_519596 [Amniculicola lignicola CBS 123094]
MAPLPNTLLSLLSRSLFPDSPTPTINLDARGLSPMAVHDLHLAKRAATSNSNRVPGAKPPQEFNNVGFQVLFALLGTGMVLTALWFFFWAKNGGFKFNGKDDWEDYKSTVLRRKGPDGKTLSNATKSTKLGGGSVVHGGSFGDESSTGYTDETATSADHNEMREVEEGKSRRFGLRGGDVPKKNRRDREHTNNYKDPELREYRTEKAARVGGLNREADGVYTDISTTVASDLGSNVSSKPLVAKPKDQKKLAKEKEQRARERMKAAKLAEKEALRVAAAEAKAKKEAEKVDAKKARAEQKKAKKTKSEATPSEYPATEYNPATEYTATEYPPTEYPATEYPATEYPATEYPATEYPPTEYPATEYMPKQLAAIKPAPRPSQSRPKRAPPSAAYSFISGDDTGTVYTAPYTESRAAPSEANESSYYSDYRPNADPTTFAQRSRRERPSERPAGSRPHTQSPVKSQPSSRQGSPRKQHRSSRPTEASTVSASSDIFTAANGNVQGTIAYPCYIPGLSSAGSASVAPNESVSQVGQNRREGRREEKRNEGRRGRDVMDGYRRGGVRVVGRRDSLSDSDS